MASRILGMGDVLTLIEKAQETMDQQKAEEMQKKMLKAEFTLEDYLDQMDQLKNMGNINTMMEMIPGMSKNKLKDLQISDKDLGQTKAIILSMTPAERRNPKIINGSRRKRIAAGSGTKVQEVNRLLKQYEQSQMLMKQFAGMASGKKGKKGKLKLPFMQ